MNKGRGFPQCPMLPPRHLSPRFNLRPEATWNQALPGSALGEMWEFIWRLPGPKPTVFFPIPLAADTQHHPRREAAMLLMHRASCCCWP